MALEAALVNFQAEARCPICLEGLTDPVTIECGHNFCRSCIQQSWADLQDRLPCPVCRYLSKEPNFCSNAQLTRIAEVSKQLRFSRKKRSRRDKRPWCEKHEQLMTDFCEDDLEMLCPQCNESPEHQGHRLTPIPEAAEHHRHKLRSFAESLKRQLEEAQELLREQSKKPLALREQMEKRRQNLCVEFELLNRFLALEKQTAMSRLEEEEGDLQERLSKNIVAFSNYGSTLKSLLGTMAQRRQSSDVELLAEVRDFLRKCDSKTSPSVFSHHLQPYTSAFPPQCSALRKAIKEFREDVILDPDTAHPNLLVSEDQTSVRFAKRKRRVSGFSKRFTVNPVVLGLPEFSSGRHFWEVQVGDQSEWAIGVCKSYLSRRARQSSSLQGCWRLVLQDDGYKAPGADPAPLLLEVKARRIGILLDWELGQLSFYDMTEKAHICTWRASFPECVQPYFYVGPHSKPLRVCQAVEMH